MDLKLAFRLVPFGGTNPPDPEDPDFDNLNTEELKFDGAWYARDGLNASGQKAQDGEPILEFPDKIGNKNMYYQGMASLPVIGSAPKKHNNSAVMENVPLGEYLTDPFTLIPFPFTKVDIVIRKRSQNYESYRNSFNSDDYLGMGDDDSRVGDNNMTIPNSSVPALYEIAMLWSTYENVRGTLAINGVEQGQVTRTSRASRKTQHVIFSGTNNIAHNLLVTYFKAGLFSSQDKISIQASLTEKWDVGLPVQEPYANSVQEQWNAGAQLWSVGYNVTNRLGAAISTTEIMWILNRRPAGSSDGNFVDQIQVGSGVNLAKSAYASLVAGYNGVYYIKCYIKITDVNGKSFGYTSSDGYSDES